jgi:hypothetical protein
MNNAYCHVLKDCRRGLDCQLDLLDLNTVTVYTQLNTIDHNTRATLHSLPSAESVLGWAQDLLQTQLSTINSYGITCHQSTPQPRTP